MKKINETIKLKDLYASAYLLTNDIPLVDILKQEGFSRATFVFSATPNTFDLLNRFSSLGAVVEPLAYMSAIRRLKQLISLPNQ